MGHGFRVGAMLFLSLSLFSTFFNYILNINKHIRNFSYTTFSILHSLSLHIVVFMYNHERKRKKNGILILRATRIRTFALSVREKKKTSINIERANE